MSETANLDVSQGGSGAPGNAAPAGNGTEGNQGARNPAGDGNQGITPAAWTAQLSKEFKDNPDALKAIGSFKTVSELAEAFVKQAAAGNSSPKDGETAGDDAFAKALEEAAKTAQTAAPPKNGPAAWLDEKAVKETVAKLIDEFGTAAPDYYRKALGKNGLGALLGKHGLKSHPDLGRALVLLGREMSEDFTPGGGSSGSGGSGGAVTIAEGARLY
jgi:hypothetical protein